MRGQAKYALENYSQAIEDLEIAVKAKPTAQTWNQIGKCYYELRHYTDAAAAYRQSAKLDGGKVDTQMYLAMSLSNAAGAEADKGKKDRYYAEALASAQKYAAAKPNDFNAQNLVGRTALGSKRYDDAIAAFNKVLQIKPDYCPAMINKAKSYVALENWKAADPTLEGAVKCEPGSAVPLELLGFVLRKEQRLEDSLVAYKKANAIAPSAGIQKAIDEVQTNIDVRDHNTAAEEAEAAAAAAKAVADAKYEEDLKKQEEWKRTQEDN
jgi:cytochrome c-type biogenesis protein CcmH/NrfG